MEVFINRVKDVNTYVNAVVGERYDLALQEAQKVDDALDSGQVPEHWSQINAPLLGVPLTVKEAFQVKGIYR